MQRALVLLTFTASVYAGTIQGVVLENISGRPIARTIVRLDPVPSPSGPKGQPLTTRAGRSGHFVFPAIVSGTYVLTAIRDGYFPVSYGQRLAIGRGKPINVTAETDLFAELRLRHKGALTGHVFDENGVATAGVPVVAYRARLPLRSAGRAVADDRGVFRIQGLEPGKYWVRSAGHTMDDGSGWLPTFGPQAREVRQARTHLVTVDSDTTDTDVNPEPGALFRLSGLIHCDSEGPVTVTLSSETGRSSTRSSCPRGTYQFDGLAPAVYEVYASLDDGTGVGFIELFLDQDNTSGTVQVMQIPVVEFEVRRSGSNAFVDVPLKLFGRRQDVAETEASREIPRNRTSLPPGHWEFRAQVPAGQYVESITNMRMAPRRPWKAERASDWFDVFIEQRAPSRIRITVSDQAGQITGRVVGEGNRPVVGVPVFLWPVADTARRSLNGPQQTLADTDGRFRFESLPSGDYRVLASFDVNEIDEELIELSRAAVIRAEASQTVTIDLTVWIAP